MNKLLDRLDRIAHGAPAGLGFVTSTKREPVPHLALLAQVAAPKESTVSALAEAQVDAFIVTQQGKDMKALERTVKPLKKVSWGATVEHLDRELTEAYKSQGSDFLVFGIEGTRADALEEGEMARVLRIPADLEESTLRALEDLPVDAVLLQRPGVEAPLALEHLLAIGNVRAAISRYLLLEWDAELTSRDLEHLRDLGVDGIVLNAENVDADLFKTVRQRIQDLPKRKPKGERHTMATISHMPRLMGTPGQREEEDEEEDF